MLRLMLGLALALSLTTIAPSPAQAAWDFSWLTSSFFTERMGCCPPEDVLFELSGTSTATITPGGSGLTIGFDTPLGPAAIHVQEDNLFAVGDVPMLACHDCSPGVFEGGMGGNYSFTGSFTDPDSFTVDIGAPPSGPSGEHHFFGTGTRQSAAASEPATLLLVGLGLAAAVARRRARGTPPVS